MSSTHCEFKRQYRRNGKLKTFETFRHGQPFGPAFEIRSNGELKEVCVWLNEQPIGTHLSWIDTGEKRCETYFSVNLRDAAIGRDYLTNWLDVWEVSQAVNLCPYDRWSTPIASPTAEQFSEAKYSEVPSLVDAQAELDWCTTAEEGLLEKAPAWPNGQIAFLGFRYGQLPSGAVITFWENGAVRTAADWGAEGVVGTRSCFSRQGELIGEQNFFRRGWSTGCWVNRFFRWEGASPVLAKVEMYKGFQLAESYIAPRIRTVLDEAFFNRFGDPLYKVLRKMSYNPETETYSLSDSDDDLINWESL
jgi:hypothetical protein